MTNIQKIKHSFFPEKKKKSTDHPYKMFIQCAITYFKLKISSLYVQSAF